MREATIKVYQYNELSSEAKDKVLDDFRSDPDLYTWHIDNQNSLIEFANWLGGIAKFEVSLWGGSFAKVVDYDYEYMAEMIPTYKEFINKCCPFTGYCMDEPLLDPLRELLGNPENIHENEEQNIIFVHPEDLQIAVQNGCDEWLKSYKRDWEYCYSEEGILDFIEANGLEFTEEGKLW